MLRFLGNLMNSAIFENRVSNLDPKPTPLEIQQAIAQVNQRIEKDYCLMVKEQILENRARKMLDKELEVSEEHYLNKLQPY